MRAPASNSTVLTLGTDKQHVLLLHSHFPHPEHKARKKHLMKSYDIKMRSQKALGRKKKITYFIWYDENFLTYWPSFRSPSSHTI